LKRSRVDRVKVSEGFRGQSVDVVFA
jgi:hypothetical protein